MSILVINDYTPTVIVRNLDSVMISAEKMLWALKLAELERMIAPPPSVACSQSVAITTHVLVIPCGNVCAY